MATYVAAVPVAVAQQAAWELLVNWERQREWVLATRVRAAAGGGRGVGARIEARTGVGPLAFLDTMVLTEWVPPQRCVVRHTGKLVRGSASFEVRPLGTGRSQVVWQERVEPPLGVLGEVGLAVLRPAILAGLWLSLRRFARIAAREAARQRS